MSHHHEPPTEAEIAAAASMVQELRQAALVISRFDAPVAGPLSRHLIYAADRLEAHPTALGGMTQGCLEIARVLNGRPVDDKRPSLADEV